MAMTGNRFSLLFLIAALTACSSGRTALRQGNFDHAVTQATNRLVRSPTNTKAPDVLNVAFAKAWEQHQTQIRRLTQTADPFRWELVFVEYEKLETLTNHVRRVGGDWLAAYPANYADRMRETRQLAAGARYEAAERAFINYQTDRLAAKEAYWQYRKAGDWVLDFRDAQAKADRAFPHAVLRVVIEPLTPSRALGASDRRELQRAIGRAMERWGQPSPFAQFIPVGPLVGDSLFVHQVVQMTVADYDAGELHDASSSQTVESEKKYKVGEKKINDTTKVDIMENVKGTLTTHTRQMKSDLTLHIRALDNQTGRVLWEDSISESRTFADEWFSFTGDERALNGKLLKTTPVDTPSSWRWLSEMTDELGSDVARRLTSYYDDY